MPGSNTKQVCCAFLLQTGWHRINAAVSDDQPQINCKPFGTRVAAHLNPGIINHAGELNAIVQLINKVKPRRGRQLPQPE